MTDSECKVGTPVLFKKKACVIASDGFRFGDSKELLYYIRTAKYSQFMGCATAAELNPNQEAK